MPAILAILQEQQVTLRIMICLTVFGMSMLIVILKCVQVTHNNSLFYVCPAFVCVDGWVGRWV